MKKNVWIINHYASNMLFDKGGRHYWFAENLVKAGYRPVIFCCNAKHNSRGEQFYDFPGIWHESFAEDIQTPFIFVKGRVYQGNGRNRVLNMIDFYKNVMVAADQYARQNSYPDVIVASSVHPLSLLAGIKLAKKYGVKCICEVRDLWPESLITYGIAGKHNPLVIGLRLLEKHIYRKADQLVFTMQNAYSYIEQQKWTDIVPKEKVFYINNGLDLDEFHYNKEHFKTENALLDDPGLFKVVYTGSIRKVNNLGLLLDAAKLLPDERITFLIWGKGDELEMLESRVKQEGIRNVTFFGKTEKNYIPGITSKADLNLIHGTETPIMQYGLSTNKMFDYLAAGKPILIDFPCYMNPVVSNDAGICIDEQTPATIAEAFRYFAHMDNETYNKFSANAKKTAEEYDFRVLTKKLISIIELDE